jgi:hypothetical protein
VARRRLFLAASIAALTIGVGTALAAPAPVPPTLANGGFESGLCQWMSSTNGPAAWVVNDGSSLPPFGLPTLSPRFGGHDAVMNEGGPSLGVLYQDFVVPAAGEVDFSYAYVDWDGWSTDTDPFDLSGDNQWLSVDVLVGGADPKSLNPTDIITTIARPGGSDPTFQDWSDVAVDLSGYVGQTVRVRFLAVDTNAPLNLYVDGNTTSGCAGGAANVPTPNQIAVCTVPGDTWPDGTPIPASTFVTLQQGQLDSDPHYKGAQPANYVYGMGLTCDQVPIGYTHQGFATDPNVQADTYAYYAPPPAP